RGRVPGLLRTAGFASAQNSGWRKLDEPGPNQSADPSTPVAQPEPDSGQFSNPPDGQFSNVPSGLMPARLTLQSGTFLTVRTNQPLSSDHNQQGDFFSATLAEPVVVDGVVVAQRGQTLAGRGTEV